MFNNIKAQMAKASGTSRNVRYGVEPIEVDLEEMTKSVLSKEQRDAIDSIESWHKRSPKPWYTLAGCAGTGKSYIIPYIVDALGLEFDEVALCAYTGKAAKILQRKGLPASTIHNLIYIPEEIEEEDGKVHIEFSKRESIDPSIQLIIIDEASMVSQAIYNDLLMYNVPILYVGDYFQLPPINDDFNLMRESDLDFKLTQIYRQAEANPIIKLSMDIRAGRHIPYGHYGEEVVKMRASQLEDSSMKNASQIICGKNVNRMALNSYLRELHGYHGFPNKNEKLIVLRNNYRLGVVNGQQIILCEDAVRKDSLTLEMEYIDENDTQDAVKLILAEKYDNRFSSFNFSTRRKKIHKDEYKKRIEADYAYAITVHKCVDEDTYLFTDNGMMKIKDLWNNSDDFSKARLRDIDYKVVSKEGFNNSIQVFKGDVEESFKLKTDFGMELIGSDRHPIYVWNGKDFEWKLVKNINEGERVLISRNNNLFPKEYYSVDIVDEKYQDKIKTNVINEDIGLLLGYIIGDGSCTMNKDFTIHFSNQDSVVIGNFIKIIEDNFEINVHDRVPRFDNKNYHAPYFISKFIRRLLFNFGLLYEKSVKKEVPEGILKSPKTVQASFLKGLFDSDGSVDKNIRLVSASETLLHQVQLMLLNFNIVSYVNSSYNKKYKRDYYTLNIFSDDMIKYRDEIGFDIPYKKDRLNKKTAGLNVNKDVLYNISDLLINLKRKIHINKQGRANEGWYRKEYYTVARLYNTSTKTDRLTYRGLDLIIDYLENCYFDKLDCQEFKILKEFQRNRYLFSEIVETKRVESQLYDIEVPEVENFVSNGFISHNSQGSEWDNVIFYDDGFAKGNDELRARFCYTAITRASEMLIWCVS